MSVKNFVQCGLVTPIATDTTELVLMAPTASYQYPATTGGTLVIADSVARPTFYEIISYTHRIDNVLYGVVRAKEGTTARAWTGTTWIYQALTAQDYVDALALKAPLASPALTGVPTAPTAPLGTNTQQIATMAAVQAAIADLVASSPAALDTLNELAAALGNDPNFATTMNNALAGKEPSIAAGTSAQMWLGNKTWASVLTQVQNTLLTGLKAGSNATILTTDTLIGALAKIQNQLNNKANFTDSRLSDAREWTATEVSQAEAEAGTATIPRKWSALRVWQAVLASSLKGLNLTVSTAVTATDTVLVAIGKLQKQITDAASNLAGSVRATVLTGYVSGSNAVLASTDTVLAAFGKLQAQITDLASGKVNKAGDEMTGRLKAQLSNAYGYLEILPYGPSHDDGSGALARLYYSSLNNQLVLNTSAGAAPVTLVAHSFYGRGGNLTELNAGALASGTIPDARLRGTYTGVNITGNAATATKLQTASTIGGVAFDGTANINLPGVNAAGNQNTSGNAATATKLANARTITLGGDLTGSVAFDGSANVLLNAALPARLGKTAQVITDWNLAIENGYYQGSGVLNAPSPEWCIGHVISHGGAGWVTQDVHSFKTDSPQDSKAFRRERNNGTWGPWYRLRTTEAEQSALYNNASNLSSGTVPDARLSGTYTGVNITGNAATATKLQTARTINGVAFDGSANITVADATKLPLTGGTLTGTLSATTFNATSTTNGGFQGIDADTAATPSFTWTGDLDTGIYRPAADVIGFTAGGAERGRVNTTGFSGNGSQLTALNASNLSTGTVAVARGGTGATATTGTGNNVLSASPALTGVPTAPTAGVGTNTNQLATTAFVQAEINSSSIGVGQTWQDVTGGRSVGTTYTNTTGRPIQLFITFDPSGSAAHFLIDGVNILPTNDVGYYHVACIVPAGSTYRMGTRGDAVQMRWMELR